MPTYRLRRALALALSACLVGWSSKPKWHIVDDEALLRGKRLYQQRAPQRPATQANPGQRPPNVVLILADDLGKTDISAYGGPHVPTPHIDSIGRDGVTFAEGYITSPICSPSRAGMMTGRYQQRFGFELLTHDRYAQSWLEWAVFKYLIAGGNFLVADELESPPPEAILQQGLPPSELTLAEVLQRQGYRTAVIGKWHLGYGEETLPLRRGFDYHYGFYDGYSFYADPKDPDIVNVRHDDFTERFIWDNARSGNCALRRNHDVIDDRRYLTSAIAEESIAWIRAHRHTPFFLYVPFSAPHTPFQATKADYDRFAHVKDPNKRIYYAMIAALDDAVGAILAELKAQDLERDTLVFFLSDNGGATYTRATDNAPLRGGKMTNFEGGINVPFMLRYPAKLPPGQRFDAPVSALDVFMTAVRAAGADLPDDRVYDGVDLLPYLEGRKHGQPHEVLYWRTMYTRAIRSGRYKLVQDDKSGRVALFDVVADKEEKRNLAKERPDLVAELEAAWQGWARQLRDPAWPPVADFRFEDTDGEWYFPL